MILVGFTNLGYGWATYLHNKKSRVNIWFFYFVVAIGLWILSMILYRGLQPLNQTLLWCRILYVAAAIIPLFFIYFADVFPDGELNLNFFDKYILWLPTIFISFISAVPNILIETIRIIPGQEKFIVFNQFWHSIYGLYIVGYFTIAYIVLFKKYLHTSGTTKIQIRYVSFGILVANIIAVTSNLTLPLLYKNFAFNWLGQATVLIMIISIAYAIMRYHLFNIRFLATELLIFFIWIFLFIRTLMAATWQDRAIEGSLLGIVILFGVLLIRSSIKEFQQNEELKKLTQDLEKANDQLSELSKFKSQLLSLASHQLKSPMAAIKGFATILIEGLYGPVPDKVKETIEKMRKSADDQLNLINTLLDLRRVEEGKMEYQFAATDLKQLVNEKLDELKLLASQKGIELNFESDGQPIWISADGPKLKQVIQNFVDNAIKYTPKGFVHVTLHADHEYAIFSVIDSGLGVPPELLPHLFEEFVRDERVKAQILGTGFGLYIAKKIMEAHGGTVWAESDGPNKGSRFYFKIRLVPQAEIQKQVKLAAAALTNKNDGI
ncbi:MAG TPA: ATP-binding protein [Patescibacteria group bacterium]